MRNAGRRPGDRMMVTESWAVMPPPGRKRQEDRRQENGVRLAGGRMNRGEPSSVWQGRVGRVTAGRGGEGGHNTIWQE